MQKKPLNIGQWMSIGQAAKYLNVSNDTLRRWEKRGKLKAVRSPSNRRYYTKKQLDRLLTGITPETADNASKGPALKRPLSILTVATIMLAVVITLLILVFTITYFSR